MGNSLDKDLSSSSELDSPRDAANAPLDVSRKKSSSSSLNSNIRKKSINTKERSLSVPGRQDYARLTEGQKSIIRDSWTQATRQQIGHRIYSRVFHKRSDVLDMYKTIERETATTENPDNAFNWRNEATSFTNFMDSLVSSLDQQQFIENQCFEWGRKFLFHRKYGFKPSYWVPFSEAITTECVHMDQAVHALGEVIGAWSSLVTIMSGRMRDGFYYELRMQRRSIREEHQAITRQNTRSSADDSLTSSNDHSDKPSFEICCEADG